MRRPDLRRARAAFSLLEVAFATAILSGLVLVVAYTAVPAQRAAADANAALDLDRNARRLLDMMRRDLRRSGTQRSGAPMLVAPAEGGVSGRGLAGHDDAEVLRLRYRTGFEETDWSEEVTYLLEQDGTFPGGAVPRYLLLRREGPPGASAVEIARDVRSLRAEWFSGGSTVQLDLVLIDANMSGALGPSGRPDPIVHRATDRVAMLNGAD